MNGGDNVEERIPEYVAINDQDNVEERIPEDVATNSEDNVEERISEDVAINERMDILPGAIAQYVPEIYIKLEDQKNTIRLEAQKNTSYSCYSFIYKIICMKRFEWKCDQLFQELLNRGTVIRGKNSSYSTLIVDSWSNLFRMGRLLIYQTYITLTN